MPADSAPTPDEAVRALAADVAGRVRRGEQPADIRRELVAGGISPELADHILTRCSHVPASRWRTAVAMTASAALLALCSAAGLAGGVWAASQVEPAPGLAAAVTCMLSAVVVLLGLAAGAGLGLGAAALLAKWSVGGSEPADRVDPIA
jgi:hypothetical protein